MRTSAVCFLRLILIGSLLLVGAWPIPAIVAQKPAPDRTGGSTIELCVGSGRVQVCSGSDVWAIYDFTSYAKPILYPLKGPGEFEVTRNYPMKPGVPGEANDHEHHKSLWFAHGDVNGLDFWSEKARIATDDVSLLNDELGTWPGIVASSRWLDGDKSILNEQATLRFADRADVRFVDFDFVLTAAVDVRFGDTKEGTFAIRTHPALQLKREDDSLPVGHAENSAGQTDGTIWGQPAEWVSYFGQIDGVDLGIAIFDHPQNLRHPTTWHARDYGLVAANPFGLHDFLKQPEGSGNFDLPQGNQLRLRYRLGIYRGAFDREKIKSWYGEFRNQSVQIK